MKPHKARILAMQAVFQAEILKQRSQLYYHKDLIDFLLEYRWIDYDLNADDRQLSDKLIRGVLSNLEKIDQIIKEYSTNWDFDRISNVNKAILRVAFYQFIDQSLEIPPKVVIDEAVKLSKEYAEDESKRFINGVLDTYYKKNFSK